MKKVIGTMSKFLFGAFGIAVILLLMSLTYGALQQLFPDSFSNQLWGLVLFDIGTICWALAFVFQSKSVGQYAASAIGFLVSLVGTLLMVTYEVVTSGQSVANLDVTTLGTWVVYGFIGVTAFHVVLLYAHHGMSPEIAEQIGIGLARSEIVTQALQDATHTLEAEKHELSRAIYHDMVSRVKRDLGLHSAEGTIFEPKQQTVEMPVTWAQEDLGKTLPFSAIKRPSVPFSQRLRNLMTSLRKP